MSRRRTRKLHIRIQSLLAGDREESKGNEGITEEERVELNVCGLGKMTMRISGSGVRDHGEPTRGARESTVSHSERNNIRRLIGR